MSTLRTEEQPSAIPVAAVVLGAAGLIPFVVLSGLILSGHNPPNLAVRETLIAYSIAILSFMGAVHWGLAMNAEAGRSHLRQYVVSVIPALAAAATVFIKNDLQFIWLAVWFLVLLAYDLYADRRGEVPAWYPRLRWPLTLVVCISLVAAALPSAQV